MKSYIMRLQFEEKKVRVGRMECGKGSCYMDSSNHTDVFHALPVDGDDCPDIIRS